MALKTYSLPTKLFLAILPALVSASTGNDSNLGTMELAQVFGQQMTPRYSPRDLYGRQFQDPSDLCGINYVLCDSMHCCRSGQKCDFQKFQWYCTEPTTISKGLAIGAIVGIVIALLILLIAIGLAIFCCCRIKRRRRATTAAATNSVPLAMNPAPAQPYVAPQANGYYPPVEGYQTSPYQPYPPQQQQQPLYDSGIQPYPVQSPAPQYPVQSPAPQYGAPVMNQSNPYDQPHAFENKQYFPPPTTSPIPQVKEYASAPRGDAYDMASTGGTPAPAPVQSVRQHEGGQAMYEIDSNRR